MALSTLQRFSLNAWLQICVASLDPGVLNRVREEVQPVLHSMSKKWNMSFTFGFTDKNGKLGLAAGLNNVWNHSIPLHPNNSTKHRPPEFNFRDRHLNPDTLVPLGSVTKPWTGLRIMQYVEQGVISLDDGAHMWVDPVLSKVWNSSLHDLWGLDSFSVTIRDLLGMTSGFADYDDETLQKITIVAPGDDVEPFLYLKSASMAGNHGWVCKPRTCGAYSGANFILLGLVLVNLDGGFSWEEFDQRTVIPRHLWNARRYPNTGFLKLGRCLQYPRIAHQWAIPYQTYPNSEANVSYLDLSTSSCLNGWTMGNIVTTGEDLASFFYDIFSLAPTGLGFVNSTTLNMMQQWHPLNDSWCEGPDGRGSCQYGLAFFKDQFAQDVWKLMDPSQREEDVRVIGHPGEDWGSGCSPCGYNKAFEFGICVGYTSLTGMNCSMDWDMNMYATYEASCLIYDAVLKVAGGPRLNCTIPKLPSSQRLTCEWIKRGKMFIGPRPHPKHKRPQFVHTMKQSAPVVI